MATPSIVPLHIFRFRVDVAADKVAPTPPGSPPPGAPVEMCFAECTGLEATMEPKTIKEGGRNYGTAQRTGGVTFATVVLKRGVSTDRGLWTIFNGATSGMYAQRLQVTITLMDGDMNALMGWQLTHALPVKFKFADLNGKGMEVGIEELHFVHEGLSAV
ncbi:MAG: phage tail protein [Bryobacteraceae bacterium]